MLVNFVAEYPGGLRVTVPHRSLVDGWPGMYQTEIVREMADRAAAHRECRRLLAERPTAYRVEAWSLGKYVTRCERGVPVEHGPTCFESCCMPTPKDASE